MTNYFKCANCGSVIFEQIHPQVFNKNGVTVWKSNMFIPPEHTNVALLRCLCCNYVTIPSCSFAGKNSLDIDIKVYREVYSTINKYNKNLTSNKKEDSDINDLKKEVESLKLALQEERNSKDKITKRKKKDADEK